MNIALTRPERPIIAALATQINEEYKRLGLLNPNIDWGLDDFLVIEANGKSVGLIVFAFSGQNGEGLELHSLTLLPSVHKHRIGSNVVKFLFEKYKPRYITGSAIAQSEPFWARMGANWSVSESKHRKDMSEWGYAPFVLYRRTFITRVGKFLQ